MYLIPSAQVFADSEPVLVLGERWWWCLSPANELWQGLKVFAGRRAESLPWAVQVYEARSSSFSEGKTEAAAKLCWKVTVSLEKVLLQIMPQTRWDICLQWILEYLVDTKQQLVSSFGINSFPTVVVAGRILLKL